MDLLARVLYHTLSQMHMGMLFAVPVLTKCGRCSRAEATDALLARQDAGHSSSTRVLLHQGTLEWQTPNAKSLLSTIQAACVTSEMLAASLTALQIELAVICCCK